MVEHVNRWLETLGLGKYAALFSENEITVDVLPELAEADLKELGLPLGPRKLLLKAIGELGDKPAELTPRIDSTRTAMPVSAAERRQLTVMFVDLVGSTALSARLDPEEMGGVLRGYQNAVAGEIARFEGHVAKFMGDGVLAYFGWPVAHEDEAERAVRAGLAIVAAVARLSGGGAALACRIGLATGLVVVGELIGEGVAQEQTVVGETPNLAARLQALAAPGQVVVAEATRRLLGAGFLLEDLGVQALKGIDGAVGAFAVTGERVLASRFDGRAEAVQPMVGRDQELALLLERWAQAASGEGQAVLLVGEAGVGKSRISRALLDALGERPHIRIRYQCSPYHTGSALWPAIQQLEHAARFAADDPPETRLDKLERALGSAGNADAAPLIAYLLGIDGTARYGAIELAPPVLRARTLEALVRQLLALATAQPVLLLIEDAHWADPTTLELIEAWLDAIASARVLLVLTSRPDNQPALAAHPHVTRLSLNRLGRAGVEAIVARLGGDRLPAATVDAIIARTDGVPLYVEELTKAVLETGETAIPASLHDSLMARLDRTPEVKEIAQTAACIGREFDHGLLAAIVDRTPDELDAGLQKLARAELLFCRGTPPDARYTFKHALVRDAAYQSLLKTRRSALHARIADELERAAATDPVVLAWHCAAAGLAERAARHYLAAGRHLLATCALPEAAGALELGLEQVGSIEPPEVRDRLELDLRLALGTASMARLGWPHESVSSALEPAYYLARRLGDREALGPILWGLWVHHQTKADFPLALEWLARLAEAAAETADSELAIVRDMSAGCQHFWLADYARAARHTAALRANYEEARHGRVVRYANHDPLCFALHWAGSLLDWITGYPAQSLAALDEAVAVARRLAHPFNTAFALTAGSHALLLRGDPERMLAQAAEVECLAAEEGLGAFTEQVLVGQWRGKALILKGGFAAGLACLQPGNAHWIDGNGRVCNALFWSWLAMGLGGLGSSREAIDRIDLAIEHCRVTGDRWMEPEALRIKARLLMTGAPPDQAAAEACLSRSIALANTYTARSWELRAARDLARLWAERGERQRAHDLLAPVYGWFTEGFDTPDLVESKVLLEELQ